MGESFGNNESVLTGSSRPDVMYMRHINLSPGSSSEHLRVLACPTLRVTGSDARSL